MKSFELTTLYTLPHSLPRLTGVIRTISTIFAKAPDVGPF
jgi:hypothetical protein